VSDIGPLLDRYSEMILEQDALDAELKDLKAEIKDLKRRIVDQMTLDETDGVDRKGRRYSLVSKTKYSKAAGNDEAFYAALRHVGLGDLIHETVNANTFNAAMNQVVEETDMVPAELTDLINVYSYTDLSVRKK